jgi:hypothetical protein
MSLLGAAPPKPQQTCPPPESAFTFYRRIVCLRRKSLICLLIGALLLEDLLGTRVKLHEKHSVDCFNQSTNYTHKSSICKL